jgi:diguanylate cyclase (GGDEF)-like protein
MEKILIIDNNPLDVRILRDILKDGYEVISSLEPEDSISKAMLHKPEIILLDNAMPRVNGKEVLFLIKNNYDLKNIPVILTLSQIDPDEEEKWLSYGIADYLIKPFSPGITKARVRTHIDLFSLNKTVEKLMLTDRLTRLPNRISYNEKIKSEWARAIREKTPISLAFIDIDHFTSYNEHYGNLKGDDVLRLVASEINYIMSRKTDFIGRYSAEKIVIILPSTTRKGAKVVAERAKSAVQNLKIPHAYSDAADVVSISIGGVTDIPDNGEEFHDFEEIADKMLYEAKAYGRNTIVWNED